MPSVSKEEINKKEIGSRIKRLRKEAGLRQWQLAEMIGATQPAIHMYERGVLPEPRRLLELARIGNTTVEWILTGRHWENGSEEMHRVPEDVYQVAFQFKEYSPEDREILESALRTLNKAVEALGKSRTEAPRLPPEEISRLVRDSAGGSLEALSAAAQVHATAQKMLLSETSGRFRRFAQDGAAAISAEAPDSGSGPRRRRPVKMRTASFEPVRGHIFRADGSFLILQDLLGDRELRGELEEALTRLGAKLEAKRSRITKMKRAQRGK